MVIVDKILCYTLILHHLTKQNAANEATRWRNINGSMLESDTSEEVTILNGNSQLNTKGATYLKARKTFQIQEVQGCKIPPLKTSNGGIRKLLLESLELR